jgi:4-amino-4-deoxy-L-arabinose transferase-like glycosyltransferase
MHLALFLCALALRALTLWQLRSDYPLFSHLMVDSLAYDAWARRIAGGAWVGEAAFYQDPLYPYALGVLYRLFGPAPVLARALQALAGAGTCLLAADTANRLFGRRAAWAAGALSATYGMFLFYEASLHKEALGVFLGALSLWLAVRAREAPSPGRWAAAGAALGLLALARGNALLLAPVLAVWLFWDRRGEGTPAAAKTAGAFLGGLLFALAPATAHNLAASGEFVLTTSQAGPNFYIGNNARATGSYAPLLLGRQTPLEEGRDAAALAEAEAGRRLSAPEVSRFWFRKALSHIASDPARWLKLLALKTRLYLSAYEEPDVEDYYLARRYSAVLRLPLTGFGLVCPLALTGAWLCRRRWRELFPLYAFVVVGGASTVLFYVFARYRLPAVPALIVLAGAALAALWERLERKRFLAAAGLAAAALALGVLTREGRDGARPGHLAGVPLTNAAMASAAAGDAAAALALAEEALAKEPDNVTVQHAAALVFFQAGRAEEAERAFLRAVESAPRFVEARYHLGLFYAARGDRARAREQWLSVLEVYPGHAEAREALAGFTPPPK